MTVKLNCVCPMCGEKTLESQSEVVWCTNLNSGKSGRFCEYGLGTGEKTTACLSAEAAISATYQEALAAAKAINRAYGPAIVFRDGSKKPNYQACAGTAADLPAGCLLITSFAEGELAPIDPQFPEHYANQKACRTPAIVPQKLGEAP